MFAETLKIEPGSILYHAHPAPSLEWRVESVGRGFLVSKMFETIEEVAEFLKSEHTLKEEKK